MLLTQLQQHHRPEQPPQLINGGSLSSPTQTSASSASNLSSNSQSSSPAPSSSSPASATDLSSCLRDADEDELMTMAGMGMAMISPAATRHDQDNFSALQRLQFALEKNALFSNVFSNHEQKPQSHEQLETMTMTSPSSVSGRVSQQQQQKQSRARSSSRRSAAPVLSYCEVEDDEADQAGRGLLPKGSPTGAVVESISLEPAIPDNIFQCPLCSITCNERHSFNEHLVTHTQQSACPKCDFITSNGEELQEHMRQVHGLDSIEVEIEDDQVPVPKVNAQSKVKKFKCKTCDHVSVTKLEFWTHTKSHIKQCKMLQCPKCPFVTEYKHHLEYHLRNHTGSKPFQCSHCQYSCVNKSMLASHLKSHSTIYQYRCADCDYATKYCHSLKMHLRKHGHSPQMVLNPDGTPNPLPIIDVYGTRRGPKLKKPNYSLIPITQLQVKVKKVNKAGGTRKKATAGSAKGGAKEPNNNSIKAAPAKQPLQIPTPRQPMPREKTPENVHQSVQHQHHRQHSQPPLPKLVPSHCSPPPLTTTTMLQGLLLQNANSSGNSYHHSAKHAHTVKEEKPTHAHVNLNNNNIINIPTAPMPKNMLELYATALNQYLLANNPVLFQQLLANNGANATVPGLSPNAVMALNVNDNGSGVMTGSGNGIRREHGRMLVPPATAAALDLRAGASPSPETHNSNNRKRTRKGRALRFDRHRQLLQQQQDSCSSDDDDSALDYSNGSASGGKGHADPRFNNNNNCMSPPRPRLGVGAGGGDKCKYCDISFPDQFLYTMHMSYHFYGDSDPFLCKCGTKTKDKVAFFVHLTTEPH